MASKRYNTGGKNNWPNISSSNGGLGSFYEPQLKRQNTHKTERLGIPQDSRLAAAVMEANGDGGRPCTCEMHYSWPNLRLINVAWESPINEPHDNHVKRGRKLVKTESRTSQVPGREREKEMAEGYTMEALVQGRNARRKKEIWEAQSHTGLKYCVCPPL